MSHRSAMDSAAAAAPSRWMDTGVLTCTIVGYLHQSPNGAPSAATVQPPLAAATASRHKQQPMQRIAAAAGGGRLLSGCLSRGPLSENNKNKFRCVPL